MKRYNINTGKIEAIRGVIKTQEQVYYVDKLSDAELIGYGYLPIVYGEKPNRRYYTATESGAVVNDEYVITYTPTARPLEEVQGLMLKDLKEAFLKYAERPRVDSGLGYFVDGSYTDKANFEIGKKHALTFVIDADNVRHDGATLADYDAILVAIEQNGISLFNTKHTKRDEILALTTVEACALYEAEPYQAVVDVLDEFTMEPTGATVEVTKYRNKVKEW